MRKSDTKKGILILIFILTPFTDLQINPYKISTYKSCGPREKK